MQNTPIKLGKWLFNTHESRLSYHKHSIELKPLHNKLLCHFAYNQNKIFTIEQLKLAVWQQQFLSDSAVKKAISELRKILIEIQPNNLEYLITIPQKGYQFRCPEKNTALNIISKKTLTTVLIAITFVVVVGLTFFNLSQPREILLVETTNKQPSNAAISGYSDMLRSTLISVLAKDFKLRVVYTDIPTNDYKLSFQVNESSQIQLILENNKQILWEKTHHYQNNAYQVNQKILSELSNIINIDLEHSTLEAFEQPRAYDFFVKGKISYYQSGVDTQQAELFFKKSLLLQPDNNPSTGALLDLYGLEERALPLGERNKQLLNKVALQLQKVEAEANVTAENIIALAKYQLVNRGDAKTALSIIEQSNVNLNNVYDMHILAYVYALNGHKKLAEQYIELAENRFPQRRPVLWYKVLVHLLNEDHDKALIQSQWAQDVAPYWYPLLYITPRLMLNNEASALQHLQQFPQPIFDEGLAKAESLEHYINNYLNSRTAFTWQPFEAEILYLLAKHYQWEKHERLVRQFISEHYPEKLMMLAAIDGWLK